MSKEKAEAVKPGLGNEIWGVSFVALALLILISLVSHFINGANNVLGPYLGTKMAMGLIKFFGKIAVFITPAAIGIIGVRTFRGQEITLKRALFWTILTIELCVLLSIHTLPSMANLDHFENNVLGAVFTYMLYQVFGPHRFGPYFIFSFAFMLTIVIGCGIQIRDMLAIVTRVGQAILAFLTDLGAKLRESWNTPSTKPVKAEKPAKPAKPAKAPKTEPTVAAPAAVAAAAPLAIAATAAPQAAEPPQETVAADEPIEEAKRLLDEELAAFRAKRKEPITITTLEANPFADVEVEEEAAEEEPEGSYAENAAVEDALADDPHGEFCKVPGDAPLPKPVKKPSKPYVMPSFDVLPDPEVIANEIDRDAIELNSHTLEKTLANFGVEGKVVNVSPGPVVTRYEIELAPGVKISRVVNLHDDLSMAVGGKRIRIEAPIPGKAAVGIELPNDDIQMVHFKHILQTDMFRKNKSKLPIIIGKNVSGMPYVTDIRKMPHLLIAGQTGSGKSVCINTIICSLLMTKKPDELRLIMIDPKKVELSYYEGIPHLLSPVVTESKEAVAALQWGVMEMMRRYKLLARVLARNIDSFNEKIETKAIHEGILSDDDNKPLPFIVIIVDELADLMMTASRDVEGLIQRIAQLARAVGIHLIVATQRPSVDIITGPIKANLTSRIGFRTIQSTDSRTILGHVGAEKLLGRGDMLFLRNGAPEIERYHGAFISEEDVENIVEEIKKQQYEIEKIDSFRSAEVESEFAEEGGFGGGDSVVDGVDDRFEEAARLIVSIGQGSTSLLQRRLKLGFARAGRLMDELHNAGIVGPQEGSKMREVMIKPDELEGVLNTLRRLQS
jgi:DNA segregation ATPase FtsK/SpoIIIE-like protein